MFVMAERYIRQLVFTNEVDIPDSPVAVEKGAVLLDTKTNTYFLQLKLANIGAVPVKSVRVYIEAFDKEGNPAYSGQTPGIAAEYSETAQVGDAFGTRKLLPVPNNNAASFRIYIEEIVTEKGYVLTFSREQHIMNDAKRDIAREREAALEAEREAQERRARENRIMWASKWYHIVFAALIPEMARFMIQWNMSFLSYTPMRVFIFVILPLALIVFAWISMGSPALLGRSAILAVIGPVLKYAYFRISMNLLKGYYGLDRIYFDSYFRSFLIGAILYIIPFLCIFFNARRFDKSLGIMRIIRTVLPGSTGAKPGDNIGA